MILKHIQFIMLTFLLVCMTYTVYAQELPVNDFAPATLLNTKDHIRYMDIKDGCFMPDAPLSRGEAATMFYTLLTDKPAVPEEIFSDVKGTDYYLEANAMGTIGIMRGIDGQLFKAMDSVTRAEFASTLRRFFPNEPESAANSTFSDVPKDYWGIAAIAFSTERGWLSGYPDGSFHPDQPITRAEAAAVMNKVLGRYADKDAVTNGENIRILLDVPQSHWAFYQIEEATIGHKYKKTTENSEQWTSWDMESIGISPGLYLFEGELYYINDNKQIVRSADIGVRHFDQNGRYTTLEPELDRILTQIILKNTDKKAPMWEKRRALYIHIRDSYIYFQRPSLSKDQKDWENSYALKFFKESRGNCHSFAAAYGLLLRKIGYDVEFIIGEVTYYTNRDYSPHGWVEIHTSEGIRIDDPEFERAHRNSNFYNFTYAAAPAFYRK